MKIKTAVFILAAIQDDTQEADYIVDPCLTLHFLFISVGFPKRKFLMDYAPGSEIMGGEHTRQTGIRLFEPQASCESINLYHSQRLELAHCGLF